MSSHRPLYALYNILDLLIVHRCAAWLCYTAIDILLYDLMSIIIISVVMVIGFASDTFTVIEADSSAILTVRVLVLPPGATAVVEFTTGNRPASHSSAIGESGTI